MSNVLNPTKSTIILPVHNEEKNLAKVLEEIDSVFNSSKLVEPFVIFVNDGSYDNSLEVIYQIIAQRGNSCCLNFSRNFGHQAAVMAGLAHTPEQSIAVVMDSDGQDPPDVALELVYQVMNGADIAYGIRKQRKGRNQLKKLAYWLFYRLLSSLSQIKIPLDAGDFCAYSPRAVKFLSKMNENHPYVRGLRAWIGLTQVGVPYNRPERYGGEPSYNFVRLVKLALDGIVSFSLRPLRLSMFLGFITFILSMILAIFYLITYVSDARFGNFRMRDVPGFTTLILTNLFFSGLHMMMLGVIGEYLGRVFEQTKDRPLFIIAETFGELGYQEKQEKQ
jgi:glycosyltransferase involved in cell wall biosynthesis